MASHDENRRQGTKRRPVNDPEQGIWAGRRIARVHRSPDGFIVLVGRNASDNDLLTFKLARPYDLWLHRSGGSGAHVVVLNPDRLDRVPRATESFAADLAATHASTGESGRFKVHILPAGDVRKPRGAPRGQVRIKKAKAIWGRAGS